MRRFGLIGYPLSHSFSQKYFNEKFIKEGIRDCLYENFPIPEIGELKRIISENPGLEGLNVTIPYKLQVISLLDDLSHLPISACNCIKISGGKLVGYNTDIVGFEKSLTADLQPHHRQALVLGKGGASEAVLWVLKKLSIAFTQVSRHASKEGDLNYEDLNRDIINQHQLIINCTPLGMFPKVNECPAIPYEFLGKQHYLFDLVYNPPITLFLRKGAQRGAAIRNGSDMLVIQAEESWKIWNS
ncbi:MAG: shikimate dehydrogenase family protein [Chitinophagales bacterium]